MKKRILKDWVTNVCLGIMLFTIFWVGMTIEGALEHLYVWELLFDGLLMVLSGISAYLIYNFTDLIN